MLVSLCYLHLASIFRVLLPAMLYQQPVLAVPPIVIGSGEAPLIAKLHHPTAFLHHRVWSPGRLHAERNKIG